MGKTFPCIGCESQTNQPHRYCKTCKDRLRHGLPVKVEDYPTQADCRRLNHLIDAFVATVSSA